ncbi:regulatory iron-sulfur-containing complex subunit RicT [Flavobacteriaceae bacterium]|nr:regulatory iron-sulfur-containing complex subunit RicT [Flavobacteriaceae bacterium]MDB9993805.1 regulatory iron-sulfur-containing complex subunit RicT [Flavobacteriaceae bacterium]
MGCTSCSSGVDGQPKGCKNNGTCGSDGCNKLTVFDWLSNMALPGDQKPFIGVEVRFKNGRKHFYKNSEKVSLSIGDVVATEAMSGHDIGIVTLTGELVKVQMKKKNQSEKVEELPKIYRKATQKDIDIWQTVRAKEPEIQKRSREIAIHLGLKMKISDIEYQGDGSKTTFYYTAEERVDFRQLIRDFASAFSTRVEMKQVGFRQEAARLGGIGSCGRELCCSTWLTDFRSVKTSAARYQQLSLNPQKLAGQCGKLKCCLNFELDTYLDALKDIPRNDIKLITEKGTAVCQKTDIFKRILWYGYEKQGMNWHKISVDKANEIIALNRKGEKVSCLEDFEEEERISESKIFENVVGQDSLTRFDKPKSKNNRKRNKGKSKNRYQTTNKKPNQNRKPKKNA